VFFDSLTSLVGINCTSDCADKTVRYLELCEVVGGRVTLIIYNLSGNQERFDFVPKNLASFLENIENNRSFKEGDLWFVPLQFTQG